MNNNHLVPFKNFPNIYYTKDEVNGFLEASPRSIVISMIVMFSTAFIFYGQIPLNLIYLWVGLQLLYLLGRFIGASRLTKSLLTDAENTQKILRDQIFYMTLGGFLWGVTTWMAVLYTNDGFIHYLLPITLGMSAGSLATVSPLFIAFVFFNGAILVPQVTALFYSGGTIEVIFGFISFIFFYAIYVSGKLFFQTKRRNSGLTQELIESESILREVNGSLEETVREKTDEILHSYHHDGLTKLPNLISCHNDIEMGLDNYIILFDISDFSTINKQYGKLEADKVLIQASQLLQRNLNRRMKLYKGESDRFIVYSKNDTEDNIIEFCKSIFSFFDLEEIVLESQSIHIAFNVGIADIAKSSEVMLNSEYALNASKKAGSKNFFFYHDYEDRISNEKEVIEWMNTTKKLIESDSIIPFYQAIQDIKNDTVNKYEVLARATLDGEIVPPFRFLEPARRLGLITTITRVMISKSFAFFEHNAFEFSINLTEEDLAEDYLLEFLKIKLKRHKIQASRITFEILENININSNDNNVVTNLKALKSLGCKIAVDDFGVENSNFVRLLELDVDYLKLDGVFIKVLDQSEKSKKIVETIVKLSKAMEIEVVAEFVENETIYEFLKDFGVNYAQGYYIGKPSPSLLEG